MVNKTWLTSEHGPMAARLLRSAKVIMEDAICFWVGDVQRLNGLQVIPELCKLPYQTCWFELWLQDSSNQPGYFGGVLVRREENQHIISFFCKYKGNWVFQFASVLDLLSDSAFKLIPETPQTLDMADLVHTTVCEFLSAMNCNNIVAVENRPAIKLQTARQKRGKKPLFSYWTLELRARDGAPRQFLGGTHEAPRFHLRRGHPRQFKVGRWTWVQECLVGNKTRGMIHKDYALAT